MIIVQKTFCEEIEKTVIRENLSYMDAVIAMCELHDVDLDLVGPLINRPIKEKIEKEATSLNFFKQTSETLDGFM